MKFFQKVEMGERREFLFKPPTFHDLRKLLLLLFLTRLHKEGRSHHVTAM